MSGRLPLGLSRWLLRRLDPRPHRAPDFVIGPGSDPYLRRWWLIPRNRLGNLYFHEVLRDDDDRALHDHPYHSLSIILQGGYHEIVPAGWPEWSADMPICRHLRLPGDVIMRSACLPHRLTLRAPLRSRIGVRREPSRGPCLSLFITGPRVREWGFHCRKGWIHWRDFTAVGAAGEVGAGCDGLPSVPGTRRSRR